MNMDIWCIELNQHFLRGSKTEKKKSKKKKSSYWQNIICDRSICILTLASDMVVLYGNGAFAI